MTISRTLSAGVAAVALVGTIGLVYAQTSDERSPQTGTTDLQTMPAQDNTAPIGSTTAPQDRSTSTTNGNNQATVTDSTAAGSMTHPATTPSGNSYSSDSGMASQERTPKPDRN